MKRCGLYVRCSTDHQTVENQITILTEVAERSGWTIVRVFEDQGISGAKGRDQRPGFDALLKAIHRREIDMAAAFAVDRLGGLPERHPSLGLRPLSPPTGCRYLHALGQDDVRSARRIFRIRKGLDQIACNFWDRARSCQRRRVRSAQPVARPCGEGREGPEGRSEHPGGSEGDRHIHGLRPAYQTLPDHGHGRPSGERRARMNRP